MTPRALLDVASCSLHACTERFFENDARATHTNFSVTFTARFAVEAFGRNVLFDNLRQRRRHEGHDGTFPNCLTLEQRWHIWYVLTSY